MNTYGRNIALVETEKEIVVQITSMEEQYKNKFNIIYFYKVDMFVK